MFEIKATIHTCGDGYWSSKSRAVSVIGLDLGYENDESTFGELRVYFNTNSWNVRSMGLIYTDSLFQTKLREFLTSIGLAGNDVGYSEQGMQGCDYVSFDVGKDFLDSWYAKHGVGES